MFQQPGRRSFLLAFLGGLTPQGIAHAQDPLAAKAELNQGVRAFNNGQYLKAVEHFQAAARLDPDSLNARLYLATTYMNQWVSGAPSEENQRNAEAARKGFQDVLDRDPTNVLAVESL